jgi:LysM repeat protein
MVMKKIRFWFFLILFGALCFSGYSQPKGVKVSVAPDGTKYFLHQVKPGETVFGICRMYQVESRDLVTLNPELSKGLKSGATIKIPVVGEKVPAEKVVTEYAPKPKEPTFATHEIKRKETPFAVAKKYNISIDDIYKYNPGLTKFKKGEKIRIPVYDEKTVNQSVEVKKEQTPVQPPATQNIVEHRVKPDETLFSISRQYGRTIDEILAMNPDAANLRIGMVLKIRQDNKITVQPETDEYFYHIVEPGETLFGVSKQFNIPEEEIRRLNPDMGTNLKTGYHLKLPAKNATREKVLEKQGQTNRHVVKQGETLTAIATKYGIEVRDLRQANPVLATREGLILGEMLVIPEKQKQATSAQSIKEVRLASDERLEDKGSKDVRVVEVPESCRPNKGGFFYESYDIALLLPLYLDANDSINPRIAPVDSLFENMDEDQEAEIDTVEQEFSPDSQIWKFYRNSESFLHFYEGVLLAVDSMRSRGMNIKLHVYDTGPDTKSIFRILSMDEFLGMDLIIGPVFPQTQKLVADFAEKNRIPMVSPLMLETKLTENHSKYFQVYPSQESIMELTAQYIADKYANSNFIIIQSGAPTATDQLLINLCRERILAANAHALIKTYDIVNRGGAGIKDILSESKENVFIIPAFNENPDYDEGEVSVAVSNINNFASDYKVTVIGDSRFNRFDAVSLEQYHNVNLKYFYPYWADLSSPSTRWFYDKFKTYFSTEPNQFSSQGYDVAFYFLNAMYSYGKNFYDCLSYLNVRLVQGNYRFEKVSNFGGYMNKGLSLIWYKNDYTVVKEKTEPEVRFIYK